MGFFHGDEIATHSRRDCRPSKINHSLLSPSQPFLPLEEPHESQHDGEAHAGYGWVAVAPVELGHIGEIHAVPAGEEGERQKDGGNDGEHFHEVVLLNGKLGLVGVLHLADDGLQILHLAGVAIDAAVENGQAVQDFFRKQRIVVEQDVVKDDAELLIIALEPHQLAPLAHDGVQGAVELAGENGVHGGVEPIFEAFEMVHVAAKKLDEKTVQELLAAELRQRGGDGADGVLAVALGVVGVADEAEIVPREIDENAKERFGVADDVVPLKRQQGKIAEVAVALELRILDEMQGFRLEKLLEPGEVVLQKNVLHGPPPHSARNSRIIPSAAAMPSMALETMPPA